MRLTFLHEAYELRIDNPGGEWLAGKRERAAEGFHGPGTGFIDRVLLPVDYLLKIPGSRDEHLHIQPGNPKVEELAASMRESGYQGHGVFMWVEYDGTALVAEGNHRIRAAKAAGLEAIPVEIRYFSGGEEEPGLLHPDTVARLHDAVSHLNEEKLPDTQDFPNRESGIVGMALGMAWPEDYNIIAPANIADEDVERVSQEWLENEVPQAEWRLYERDRVWQKPIYRIILAPSIEDIRWDSLGIFWAWDRNSAQPYYFKEAQEGWKSFLVEAMVEEHDWDWDITIALNALPARRSEKEARIKKGVSVRVLKVYENRKAVVAQDIQGTS